MLKHRTFDSSVGRASVYNTEGHSFDPGSKDVTFCLEFIRVFCIHVSLAFPALDIKLLESPLQKCF